MQRTRLSTSWTPVRSHDVVRWSYMWNSCTPPKVRTFVWRASNDALPTACNLAKRCEGIDRYCTLCMIGDETLEHVLFYYSFAGQVWALSSIPWRVVDPMAESVQAWMRRVPVGREGGRGQISHYVLGIME
ncbi:hypothetical protein Salat_2894900 [Sesamum alatum]|uniref:Reverse transcriptase zinc-binding domain-containing protein n=1 Tax=Sesamum alatum TaxID=300844 RepID=A0AAE1XIP2_9LAMI|nr:hypothetical protein Salat_2894900 [Sesamum alatum]